MKRFIVIATVLAFSSMAFGQYVTDADFVSDWGDVVPYGSDPNTFSDHQVTGFDDSAAYDGTDQSGISGYNFGARTPVQRDKSIHQKYGMGINDGETGKINFEINRGGITMPSIAIILANQQAARLPPSCTSPWRAPTARPRRCTPRRGRTAAIRATSTTH